MKQKKYFLLALCFLAFTASTYAQGLDTLRRKDVDNWEFLQVRNGAYILAEGYHHNGITEGTWITYWPSGYPMEVTNYTHGKKNGVSMQVNAQGYTESVANYKNDLLDGPQRNYQIGTSFISEESYYTEGKKNGNYKKAYTNGKPQEVGTYNMGKRDGKTTWYYESGEKAAEYSYNNGSIDGEVSSYYKNGKVNEFGVYKNNEQTGLWKEFYENGNLKGEGEYKHGQREGAWKQYDENGKFIKTVKYKNGEER